jgi:hypothetical protein
LLKSSLVAGVYETTLDRESAYEKLKGAPLTGANSTSSNTAAAGSASSSESGSGLMGSVSDFLFGSTGPRGGQHDGVAQLLVKSAVRNVGSSIGREIVRGVLGGLLGSAGKRRR